MASLSTVIQGLLVDQLPEYEISNDAIGYLCDFSEKLLAHLVNGQPHADIPISHEKVKQAILSTFPNEWAELILRAATAQLGAPHVEERDSILKQEISDFELIDAEQVVPEVERKASGNLFLSPEFIKSFLSAPLESEACIYLSVCVESVLSKLIHQGLNSLRKHIGEDQTVITRLALVEAITGDDQLSQLAKALNLYEVTNSDDIGMDFEPILQDSFDEEESKDIGESNDTNSKVWSEIKESSELKVGNIRDDSSVEENGEVHEASELKADDVKEAEMEEVNKEEVLPAQVPEVTASEETKIETEVEVESEPIVADSELAKLVTEPNIVNSAKSEDVLEESISTRASEVLTPAELFANPSDLTMVRKPIVNLHARCCPYFDASTFAIHMLSSIVELFIRHVIRETSRIAQPHSRVAREHAREAVRRLTTFQSQMLDEINCSDDNVFKECVSNQVKIVPRPPEWNTDTESYIAEVVLYVCTRIMLVAAAQARLAGLWVIHSQHIATASLQLLPSPSPIAQLVQKLADQNAPEGPMAVIPSAPRIKAAEMLYLNSIIKETPLQLDNQLLVIFMFLVTLSIHTLCCVR